ncbi:MAG TPA: nitroreductase family protein [Candidatus Merdimorpha stercoravium]|uniref:Nitroreductase family protein n=1 Tax=Candidatus Merdimorpha stercoravium TaxID=2840863 RepID=A0A9D1HB66_9FLAO|nr:nitroreductase family protein [Candidatus Merdimorpha stercoravium]
MEKQYAQNPAIENILTRRSIRSYTDQDVEPEKLEAILEAGMAAPSGKNGQPWDFVVLTRREILDEMAERLPYAKMLREARVAIAVCADRTKSPYWYVDCSAAAENILLAAHALGLGAVWTATYPYRDRMDVVKELCGLPGSYDSLCVIPVGYPAREARPKDNFDPGKIHHEVY